MPGPRPLPDHCRELYLASRPQPLTERDYQRWGRAALARVGDWLPPDRRTPVLDLGCGSGRFLYLLERLGYEDLTGVDLSPASLALARRYCPRSRLRSGEMQAALAGHPRRFGLIAGFDVLEHVPKTEIIPLLALVAGSLTPGGRVIFQTPNGDSPWVGAVGWGDFTHEWLFTPASLAQVLEYAGFQDFTARECGPQLLGVKQSVRWVLWQVVKAGLLLYNLVETGHVGSGIYSRVFVATAVKGQ